MRTENGKLGVLIGLVFHVKLLFLKGRGEKHCRNVVENEQFFKDILLSTVTIKWWKIDSFMKE